MAYDDRRKNVIPVAGELAGSPAQVTYAIDIRGRVVADILAMIPDATPELRSQIIHIAGEGSGITKARYWLTRKDYDAEIVLAELISLAPAEEGLHTYKLMQQYDSVFLSVDRYITRQARAAWRIADPAGTREDVIRSLAVLNIPRKRLAELLNAITVAQWSQLIISGASGLDALQQIIAAIPADQARAKYNTLPSHLKEQIQPPEREMPVAPVVETKAKTSPVLTNWDPYYNLVPDSARGELTALLRFANSPERNAAAHIARLVAKHRVAGAQFLAALPQWTRNTILDHLGFIARFRLRGLIADIERDNNMYNQLQTAV